MDDPEHNRIRRMVMREFRVQHVEARRSQIERFTHEHIDRMLAKGTEADLVSDFALPIPSLAIADLLGVADGDAELFQRCATVLIDLGSTPEEIGLVSSELFEFLDRLVIQKMESPGDDLVSRLATKYMASGELTHEEVVLSCFLLLVAGHETTANMIAMGTLALLEHPDQLEKFRTSTDPTMITNSIEELLRYLSIVSNGPVRVALEDVTIGGHLIRKGMGVIINLPTANRDPAAGAIPDVLDLERKDNKHIAFGAGTHQCLGMHLARLELAVTLPALFSRLQGLRLSVPLEDIPFRHQSLVFGAFSVPVTWDA
ncbi:cytochrome P450 [Specibacter sp. RAF43]